MLVKAEMLYAGQGMCNCITIYEGVSLEGLYIIDMGSIAHGKGRGYLSNWGPSQSDMVTVVDKYLEKTNGVIDLLVISHLDEDHYNYVVKLSNLQMITRLIIGGTAIGTRQFDYGGLNSHYTGQFVGSSLKSFFGYMNKITIGQTDILNAHSDYASGGFVAGYDDSKGSGMKVLFRVLLSRCFWNNDNLDNASNRAWYINGNSAMIVMECYCKNTAGASPDFCMIFPGDAIHMTFEELCNWIDTGKIQCEFLKSPASWRGMVAAHHGSYETNNGSAVVNFLDRYQPNLVTVSAGMHETYKHPNREIVDLYARYAQQVFSTHKNMVYINQVGYMDIPYQCRIYTNYWEEADIELIVPDVCWNRTRGYYVKMVPYRENPKHKYRKISVSFGAMGIAFITCQENDS